MSRLKLAVLVRPLPDPRAAAEQARAYEAAGIDVLVTGESYGFDAVSWLGFLAAVTERVELAAHVLPIYPRTPALTLPIERTSASRKRIPIPWWVPMKTCRWPSVTWTDNRSSPSLMTTARSPFARMSA